ncbi:uncharacterized protein N0V89_001353 [Didymosphaeria variabile]|uniref:DUF4789 domain-containing protein n=1 Tax=Didymosphaeria variabile TaxID=1932322 RepID=A0A9W9CGQ9_9PLEO|nr:uncharacterized protein N0V89_001353 [Didymosphaeria variabile]KAJ4360786.1 hypothetical protein N0V89_001353 [Didymosphaeria variabile]
MAMFFTVLAITCFGVLSIHASEKPVWDIAWRKTCGPLLDAHKKCAPNTITGDPIYWICNGEERTWEPTDERCKFGYEEGEEAPTTDGDWHIGCDDSDHCGYYKDHPNKRSIGSSPDTATGSAHAGLSPRKSPDGLNIPDRKGIHTRCSLTSFDLVEKFSDKRWIHHYKCPPGTACSDILGSGACRAGGHDFTIPGRSYLWAFKCPDAYKDPKTCHFADSVHALDSPKPLGPYLNGTTRCSPNGRTVQYLDGKQWKDIYACTAKATCVEHRGQGGCQAVQSLAYPLTSRSLADKRHASNGGIIQWPTLQRDEEDQPPTRCNPEIRDHVQYFSEFFNEWQDFHTCEYASGCHNFRGKAYCHDAYRILVPSVDLISGVDGGPPRLVVQVEQAEDDSELPQIEQKIVLAQAPIQTRCDPLDETQRFVQYLHPSAQQWLRFYQCSGPCFQFMEYAACEEYRDKYVIPSPPTQNFPKRAARPDLVAPDDPLAQNGWGSRCDALYPSGVIAFFRGQTIAYGECPNHGACRETGAGFVVCDVNGRPYLMEAHGQTRQLPRQDPYDPHAPDFNMFDTRCNPGDPREVQRHNGTTWDVEGGPNGGCAAPSLYDVLTQIGVASTVADADRDVLPRSPKREMVDDRLLRNSERLTEQGKMLIDEGEELTAQSDSLLETFFGPRDSATSFEDFAAMEEFAADPHNDIPSDAKEPKDAGVPDTSLVPTAADRAVHCRDTSGLVDDSVSMHKQGAHLVEEGNKLVAQGTTLLKTIFGAQTDEYIRNITGRGTAGVTGAPIIVDLPEVSDLPEVDIDKDAKAGDEDTGSDTE